MKILNLKEYDCCSYTSLFIGNNTSPEVDEMRNIVIEKMREYEYAKVDHASEEDKYYVKYHNKRDEEVRDKVIEVLNSHGYFEFTPKEIAIGD
jgi:hypothetical protein